MFAGAGYQGNGQIGLLTKDAEAAIVLPALLATRTTGGWSLSAATRPGVNDLTEISGALHVLLPWDDHIAAGVQYTGIKEYAEQRFTFSYARRLFEKLKETFQTDPQFADLRGRVTRFDFGPPIGFPVQFRVIGPEASEVRRIAGELRDSLRTHPDMRDVNLDWSERSKNVRLEVNQDRARLLGLSPKDISDNLQTILAGLTISQYREGTETIDVVARAVPDLAWLQGADRPDLN